MRLNRRVLVSRGSVAGAIVIAGSVWAGCAQTKPTEFVAGISSQVQVPRDLATVVITVSVDGALTFNQSYPVYDGTVRLPRTLGVVRNTTPAGTPITITVVGFDGSPDGTTAATNAGNVETEIPTVGQKETAQGPGGARVLRSFRQPYQQDQIVYVPMPLHYSCYDVDCGPNSGNDLSACGTDTDTFDPCTCKAGVCVDALNDPTVNPLPAYDDALAYGSTNTCFRPFTSTDASGSKLPGCMDYGIPPQTIDATNCIFALPDTASVPPDAGAYNPEVPSVLVQAADSGGGLNVRVVFDNLVSEVLDSEGLCPPASGGVPPVEGYCIVEGAPQRFMLAPGLCSMLPGAATPNLFHSITLMEADGECPAKTQFQPICDDAIGPPFQPTLLDGSSSTDGGCNVAKALTPAPSALYILWDKSSGMREFFGQQALKQVLSVSLGDPVFNQTQIAFAYTPGPNPPATPGQSDCTAAPGSNSFETPLINFEPSIKGQADIGNNLLDQGDGGTFAPGNTPWYLEAALDGTYQALVTERTSAKETFNRTAVMLFFDRDFATTPPDCGGSHKNAIQEAQAGLGEGIETYVVYLKNADDTDAGGNAGPQALSDATALAMGFNPNLKYFFDASQGSASALAATQAEALATIVADLGSCVYEVPQGIGPEAILSFPDLAVSKSILNVKNADDCSTDDPATTPTWVFDNQHIHVCPDTCQRIIDAVQADQANTAQNNILKGTANVAAGITVYATEACGAPSAGPIVEASVPNSFDANVGTPGEDAGEDGGGTEDGSPTEDGGAD